MGEGAQEEQKTRKLGIFCDVQISRIQGKIHHVQDQLPSIKCAYRKEEVYIHSSITYAHRLPLSD